MEYSKVYLNGTISYRSKGIDTPSSEDLMMPFNIVIRLPIPVVINESRFVFNGTVFKVLFPVWDESRHCFIATSSPITVHSVEEFEKIKKEIEECPKSL